MRSSVRAQLEANQHKLRSTKLNPESYRPKKAKKARPKRSRSRRTFTEQEADELLAIHAPNWPDHLNDGRVIDHIVSVI